MSGIKLKHPDDFLNKIVCGDCLKVMRKISEKSINLVVTSLPYNLKNSTGNGMKDGRGGKRSGAVLLNGYSDRDDCVPHDEYVKWQREFLSEAMRILNLLICMKM